MTKKQFDKKVLSIAKKLTTEKFLGSVEIFKEFKRLVLKLEFENKAGLWELLSVILKQEKIMYGINEANEIVCRTYEKLDDRLAAYSELSKQEKGLLQFDGKKFNYISNWKERFLELVESSLKEMEVEKISYSKELRNALTKEKLILNWDKIKDSITIKHRFTGKGTIYIERLTYRSDVNLIMIERLDGKIIRIKRIKFIKNIDAKLILDNIKGKEGKKWY